MKKIKITETQFNNLFEDYTFHVGNDNLSQYPEPYHSEPKNISHMHQTGDFGSGTYFCSHNMDTRHSDTDTKEPGLIKINDGLYQVDLDFYQNLYKVESKKEAKVLYTLCSNLNRLYGYVSYGKYDTRILYQTITNNAKHLGLNVPPYRELMKKAREMANNDDRRSLSTWFMEQNGYNGINVSGIPDFDNTTHGSVIYDLSKTSIEPIEKNKQDFYTTNDASYDKTIAKGMNDFNDRMLNSLEPTQYVSIFGVDDDKILPYIKNVTSNQSFINQNELKYLEEKYLALYLRLLYKKSDSYDNISLLKYLTSYNVEEAIHETHSYFWVNYDKIPYNEPSMLINILCSLWEDDEQTIREILSYLERKPTDEEIEWINRNFPEIEI